MNENEYLQMNEKEFSFFGKISAKNQTVQQGLNEKCHSPKMQTHTIEGDARWRDLFHYVNLQASRVEN